MGYAKPTICIGCNSDCDQWVELQFRYFSMHFISNHCKCLSCAWCSYIRTQNNEEKWWEKLVGNNISLSFSEVSTKFGCWAWCWSSHMALRLDSRCELGDPSSRHCWGSKKSLCVLHEVGYYWFGHLQWVNISATRCGKFNRRSWVGQVLTHILKSR